MTSAIDDVTQLHLARDAVRRRWRIILGCLVLTVGLGTAAAMLATPSFTATSTVLLRPLAGNALDPNSAGSSNQVTIAMETESGLVASPEVATLASRQLGYRVPAGSPQVSATVPTNTETVQVAFTAASPIMARDGAQAFAGSMLQVRSERAEHIAQGQLNAIEKQAKAAQTGLTSASKAAKSKDAATAAAADAQVQLYASRLSSLEERTSELKSAGTDPGFVVTPAAEPGSPNGLSGWMYIVAACILGLLAGFGIAIWREWNSDVVRAETEDALGEVPILSLLPGREGGASRLLSDAVTDASAKDAYRTMRVGALARVDTSSIVAISDLSDTDRAGEISANLAVSLSEAGHRITLVDATTTEHEVTHMLGGEGKEGLSDVLAAENISSLPLCEATGVQMLPYGTRRSAQMRDLLAGGQLRSVFNRLRTDAELVLVAAPPASSADGNAVIFGTDGVILVLAEGRTTHAEVREFVRRSSWLGVPVVGMVSVLPDRRGRSSAHGARRGTRATAGPAVDYSADSSVPAHR